MNTFAVNIDFPPIGASEVANAFNGLLTMIAAASDTALRPSDAVTTQRNLNAAFPSFAGTFNVAVPWPGNRYA